MKPQTWKDYRGNGKPNVAERNRRISVGLRLYHLRRKLDKFEADIRAAKDQGLRTKDNENSPG